MFLGHLLEHHVLRAAVLNDLGRWREAAAAVREMPTGRGSRADPWVGAAGELVRCAALAAVDRELGPEGGARALDELHREALALVRHALDEGFDRERLRAQPQLGALGSDPEFRALLGAR
jgi:hypothetical protein